MNYADKFPTERQYIKPLPIGYEKADQKDYPGAVAWTSFEDMGIDEGNVITIKKKDFIILQTEVVKSIKMQGYTIFCLLSDGGKQTNWYQFCHIDHSFSKI